MKNKFIFFSLTNDLNFPKSFTILSNNLRIKMNVHKFRRFFSCNGNVVTDNLNDTFYIYLIEKSCNSYVSSIEYENLFFDCDLDVKDFLFNNNIFGVSSVKQNKMIYNLIFFKKYRNNDIIYSILGEDGWNSLSEYFEFLHNSDIEYVSLRKNELLPYSFIENDKDIDILCANKNKFVSASNAEKRSMGISGYKIKVCNEWIPLDVRYVGDNYFDNAWEKQILNDRIINQNGIYVMDEINQLYSILYHVLTQKKSVSEYYFNIIKKSIDNVSIDNLLRYLILFLKNNNYYFLNPLDKSVVQNRKNIKIIKNNVVNVSCKKKIFSLFFSHINYRFIPKKILGYLFEIN